MFYSTSASRQVLSSQDGKPHNKRLGIHLSDAACVTSYLWRRFRTPRGLALKASAAGDPRRSLCRRGPHRGLRWRCRRERSTRLRGRRWVFGCGRPVQCNVRRVLASPKVPHLTCTLLLTRAHDKHQYLHLPLPIFGASYYVPA